MEKFIIKVIFTYSSAFLLDEKGNLCSSEESAKRFNTEQEANDFSLPVIHDCYGNNVSFCIEPVKQ